MNTITNNFTDVEMWNLNPGAAERGPFLVVQRGLAPDDPRMRDELFMLRPDGRWVDELGYLVSEKPELLDEAVFDSGQQVMELLGRLGSEPQMADASVDEQALRAWQARVAGTDPLQIFKRWMDGYKERHASK